MSFFYAVSSTAVRNDPRCNLVKPTPGIIRRITNASCNYVANRVVGDYLHRLCRASSYALALSLVSRSVQSSSVQAACFKKVVMVVPYVGCRVAKFAFWAVTTNELEIVARQSFLKTAQALGFGSMLAITGAFVVRQGMNTVWLIRGTMSRELYRKKTMKNAAGSAAGVAGAATGAALGTLAVPGVGAGFGAFVGGLLGSTVAEMVARRKLQIDAEELKALPSEDQWLLVEIDPQSGEYKMVDEEGPVQDDPSDPDDVNIEFEVFVDFNPPATGTDRPGSPSETCSSIGNPESVSSEQIIDENLEWVLVEDPCSPCRVHLPSTLRPQTPTAPAPASMMTNLASGKVVESLSPETISQEIQN